VDRILIGATGRATPPIDVTIDLAAGTALGDGTNQLAHIENVFTTGGGNDVVAGSAGTNLISTGAGNDHVESLGGDDIIFARDLGDHLDGGTGTDRVGFARPMCAVNADLSAGSATDGSGGSSQLVDVENLRGTGCGDILTGSESTNVINGVGGSDTIDGGAGDDRLTGEIDDDTVIGGSGTDTVFSPGIGVVVDLLAGTLAGPSSGHDLLSGIENVAGTKFRDILRGDEGPNVINGRGGRDDIMLRGGDDHAIGGSGDDTADGGPGTDLCEVETSIACE